MSDRFVPLSLRAVPHSVPGNGRRRRLRVGLGLGLGIACVIMAEEGTSCSVVARSSMVMSYNKVCGAVVAANDAMEDGLTRAFNQG